MYFQGYAGLVSLAGGGAESLRLRWIRQHGWLGLLGFVTMAVSVPGVLGACILRGVEGTKWFGCVCHIVGVSAWCAGNLQYY